MNIKNKNLVNGVKNGSKYGEKDGVVVTSEVGGGFVRLVLSEACGQDGCEVVGVVSGEIVVCGELVG